MHAVRKHRQGFVSLLILIPGLLIASLEAQSPQPQPPPELIIDQIKKAVVFVQGTFVNTDGKSDDISGTAFLISEADPRRGRDSQGHERGFLWLITSKHMIRERLGDGSSGPYLTSVQVRYNLKEARKDSGIQFGTAELAVVDADHHLLWFTHPTDETVDLAAMHISIDENVVDFRTIGTDLLATRDVIRSLNVNENDEVLFTGLFAPYSGIKKNYPIVRHGKIALIPQERVPIRVTPDREFQADVYLAEVMSFGGNSGSPVFLRVPPLREMPESPRLTLNYQYYLLGVMEGFFPENEKITIEVRRIAGRGEQNSGVAVVVPADKIIDVLSSPRARAFKSSTVAADYAKLGNLADAERLYRESLQIFDADPAISEHPDVVGVLRGYAGILRKLGRASEAAGLERRAAQIEAKHSPAK